MSLYKQTKKIYDNENFKRLNKKQLNQVVAYSMGILSSFVPDDRADKVIDDLIKFIERL